MVQVNVKTAGLHLVQDFDQAARQYFYQVLQLGLEPAQLAGLAAGR